MLNELYCACTVVNRTVNIRQVLRQLVQYAQTHNIATTSTSHSMQSRVRVTLRMREKDVFALILKKLTYRQILYRSYRSVLGRFYQLVFATVWEV